MLQFQRAAPKEGAWGDPWVLCKYEDLVGRGKGNEVNYEADGDGQCWGAIQLGC